MFYRPDLFGLSPSEESAAGVAADGAVVKVGRGGAAAHRAGARQALLLLPLLLNLLLPTRLAAAALAAHVAQRGGASGPRHSSRFHLKTNIYKNPKNYTTTSGLKLVFLSGCVRRVISGSGC